MRNAEFGIRNGADASAECGMRSSEWCYANSITSEASNKVLTVKMLFDFHFCFSKTVRKNR